MKEIKALFGKHREILFYLIFGVLTTLVNFVSFWLMGLLIGEELYLASNAVAWVLAVVFAYVTNKLFVFESKSWSRAALAAEIPEFLGARIFSFLLEEGGMWLLVDILGFRSFSFALAGITATGTLIAKAILAVVVVILNYFFSKFIIFKRRNS